MILGKKTLKSVENKFFNYQKIKDAIIDARAEQDSKGGFTGGDNGHIVWKMPVNKKREAYITLLTAALI